MEALLRGGVQQAGWWSARWRCCGWAVATVPGTRGGSATHAVRGAQNRPALPDGRYGPGGVQAPRPGAAELLAPSDKQRIIAMVCRHPRPGPPAGRCAWWPRKRSSGSWFPEWAGKPSESSPKPRPQAVAGKKCGAWPIWMRSTSRTWKTCWRYTKSLTMPGPGGLPGREAGHAARRCPSPSARPAGRPRQTGQ